MEILIIFILILLNGIFSMSEIALVSAKRFKLEAAARKGNSNAKKALELSESPDTFLSTVQIGITLIGILTGIYSGDKITVDMRILIEKISFLAPYSRTLSVVIVLILLTFFSIVIGELIPKRLGLMFPERIAMLVAKPMTLISVITRPFIWLLTKANKLILGLFGLGDTEEANISEEEIKAIVQESAENGEIQEIEQDIVKRVFALGDRKAREIMTHRSDLVWFDIDDTLETIQAKAEKEIHSVYIVADKNLDRVKGILPVKGLFPMRLTNETFRLADHIKDPILVHENMAAYEVLRRFKEEKLHYALVIDEYGILQGLTAMDDVLDALLGESTEYNHTEYGIVKRDDDTWLADAQLPFYAFLEYFGINEANVDDTGFNTLGGLILSRLHHIPQPAETCTWHDFRFEVLDMDGIRIDKVLISRLEV